MKEAEKEEKKLEEEKSFVQNALNLGFGLMAVTRDKVEKVSADLVRRGELTSREARKWVQELEKSLDKERKYLDSKVSQNVKEFIQKFRIPSRSEFESLTKEVTKLRREVSRLKSQKKTTGKRTVKKTPTRRATKKS